MCYQLGAIALVHTKVNNYSSANNVLNCRSAKKVINCNSAKKVSLTSCAHKSYRSFDAILRFLYYYNCLYFRVNKLLKVKKSQNCVKAAIDFVCTTCKRQLLFALLQKITFVCTIATDN